MRSILKWLSVSLGAGVLIFFVWTYLPASAHYQIRETYSFRTGDHGAKVRLAVMIPVTGPYQEVRNLAISWNARSDRESHRSVEVVKLEGQIEAHQEKSATIAYDVILHQGIARWDGPTEESQLRPQPGIESQELALVRAAAEIARGQSRDDAYRIHQFTAGRLRWGSSGSTNWASVRLQSAVEAYQERKGVCGDFANLMTALCRAARIPAQSISGLQLPAYPPLWTANGAAWGSPAVTHGWVEFRTERGWEMADPSAAHWLPVKSLAFGRNDGCHLSYGERVWQDRIWHEMTAWAEAGGTSVGSMIGPLRFAAAADRRASFTPQATVRVTWNGRWVNLFTCLLLLTSAFAVWNLRTRPRKRSQTSNAAAQPAGCSEPREDASVSSRQSAARGR